MQTDREVERLMGYSYYNDPHPNSLEARATPEQLERIRQGRKRDRRDAQLIEKWARDGFMSGGQDRSADFSLERMIAKALELAEEWAWAESLDEIPAA